MRASPVLVSFVFLGLAASISAQDGQPVFSWLDTNAPSFASMVKTLGIKPSSIKSSTTGTLLVPTDKAVDEFLMKMRLTKTEFLARKQLVDQVVSYHFIPGYQAKNVNDVPGNPTLAVSADVNYILRFYKASDPKTPGGFKVWVQDVQGNNVTIQQKPILLNKVSIIPINKVLMAGGYFFSGKAALKHYPQWSDAFKVAEKAGWPTDGGDDLTMFVPDNAAVTGGAASWSSMSTSTQKQQLLYHFVKPAMSIPQQIKSGRLQTLLKGHSLMVDVAAKTKDGIPMVKVTPEVGGPVQVVIFNIYAGRAVLQGIEGNLRAKLAAVTAESGAAPKAAGSRNLLKDSSSSSSSSNRALLGVARRGYGNSGYNQMTANSIAATNTQYAIEAAANGDIPVGAATRYGSYQAQAASEYNNYCYNCRRWN